MTDSIGGALTAVLHDTEELALHERAQTVATTIGVAIRSPVTDAIVDLALGIVVGFILDQTGKEGNVARAGLADVIRCAGAPSWLVAEVTTGGKAFASPELMVAVVAAIGSSRNLELCTAYVGQIGPGEECLTCGWPQQEHTKLYSGDSEGAANAGGFTPTERDECRMCGREIHRGPPAQWVHSDLVTGVNVRHPAIPVEHQ